MPKGKRGGIKSLTDGVDEKDIVNLDEEQNAPNILIDNNYGITGMYGDYALVKKCIRHRTGKEEDGEYKDRVIRYISWEDICYCRTVKSCLESYLEKRSLSEIKALKKTKEWQDVINIYNAIRTDIDKCIGSLDLTKEEEKTLDIADNTYKLKQELKNIQDVLDEADDLHNLIKEKRKIIINDTKKM